VSTFCEEKVPRPFRTALRAVVLNIQTWRLQDKADSENNVILEMNHVGNYEEFSCIDNSLQCYNKN
jgi:hypothetical protein